MLTRDCKRPSVRSRNMHRDERGAVALVMALFITFMALPLSAIAVDTARHYVEAQRVQAAADAAAAAGVTYLPDRFDLAQARAKDIAGDNGFPDSGTSSVEVEVGEKPTQLKVSVSSVVNNTFAAAFGDETKVVTRSAVADYNGPAPMGSPCNTFGNEPAGTPLLGPVGSQLQAPPSAQCSTNPEFWANVAGPDFPKNNGDRFMTRGCGSGTDGCTGTTNDEFDPRGYFYVISIGPQAVGRTVRIQLFDPSFVEQGDFCGEGPLAPPEINRDDWNSYVNDARARYYRSQSMTDTNSFCTGDTLSGDTAPVTSFGLRGATLTGDPRTAPPITECARQYPGYKKEAATTNALRNSSPTDVRLQRLFHQWVTFCDFVPAVAGDYYLQVRTNVALSAGVLHPDGGYTGNQMIFSQAGDDTSVRGHGANRFAIRAFAPGLPAGAISVAAFERMPIYANADGAATEFNLVRVIPAAATKTMVFSFFDVGEGASGGTMRVIPPADSNLGSMIAGCVGSGRVNGPLTNCQISGISSAAGWNGKTQEIRVPIPNNYTCQAASPGGCWFRVAVNFGGGGAVNDSTTWTAVIEGEPVRLIE